ncbi:MAG TPA: zf-HC2 domain-containing protein [Candidatus Dormibacteraeota bacterium]|jgi:anti-sigma factor RsiW|nr:zf-HC2 domain-containing protein [Candidatus Dormibacteraeota bacterium]
MNWTCEQTELRLSDYLDGLLTVAEKHEFDAHVNTCARCTPLVSSVTHALSSLRSLPQIEPTSHLVYNILDKTLGPRETVTGWAAVLAWFRGFNPQRLAYGGVSFCAMFLMFASFTSFSWKKPRIADLAPAKVYQGADRQAHLVYARGTKFVSDLRVVYEIQSRLQRTEDLQNNQDSTTPKSSPEKDPGRTDGSAPASPKQQNRANDLGSHAVVLAAGFPACWEGRIR